YPVYLLFFSLTPTPTPEIYTLSLQTLFRSHRLRGFSEDEHADREHEYQSPFDRPYRSGVEQRIHKRSEDEDDLQNHERSRRPQAVLFPVKARSVNELPVRMRAEKRNASCPNASIVTAAVWARP